MKIHIKSFTGKANDSTITLVEDGKEIENISAVDIQFRPGKEVTATLQFGFLPVDVIAKAVVSEQHLRELAAAHGFDLVKKQQL